jgi:hypothetical protein
MCVYFNAESKQNIRTDYMLMDSNSFMGGKGEAQYSQVIGMYMKVWDLARYGLFTGCY